MTALLAKTCTPEAGPLSAGLMHLLNSRPVSDNRCGKDSDACAGPDRTLKCWCCKHDVLWRVFPLASPQVQWLCETACCLVFNKHICRMPPFRCSWEESPMEIFPQTAVLRTPSCVIDQRDEIARAHVPSLKGPSSASVGG